MLGTDLEEERLQPLLVLVDELVEVVKVLHQFIARHEHLAACRNRSPDNIAKKAYART